MSFVKTVSKTTVHTTTPLHSSECVLWAENYPP